MIATDETALICDLAETYGILDFRQLPLPQVAAFSVGLRNNSRIKMALSDQRLPLDTILLAGINDRLSILIWQQTKDGQKGTNQPKSVVEMLVNEPKEREVVAFNSGEDFEKMRRQLLEQIGGDG
ncbi:TPA: DUF5361 domain-containing protein [Streptococcus suis]